jgi:hypothetical protein
MHPTDGSTAAQAEEQWLEERVAVLEAAWMDAEIALETLRVEMDNFALVHHQRLGPVYARLDELDALIAEAVAARTGDPEDIRRAYQARSVVEPMPDLDAFFSGRDGEQPPPPPAFDDTARRIRPSREAQRLYRDLARRAHPDLVTDPAEKERRGAFIARVNAAYGAGDLAELEALAAEWQAGPDGAPAAGEPDRIGWLRRRLEWLAARIERLAEQRADLDRTPMGELLKLHPEDPDALLEQLADQLLAEVARRQRTLDAVLLGTPIDQVR